MDASPGSPLSRAVHRCWHREIVLSHAGRRDVIAGPNRQEACANVNIRKVSHGGHLLGVSCLFTGAYVCRHNSIQITGDIMGLMSFMKEAGQKLFGHKDAEAANAAAQAAPDNEDAKTKAEAANAAAADAIVNYIHAQNLDAKQLDVLFDGAASTVNVYGVAADQATKEKILLCCGNVAGVASVNDKMEVEDPKPEAQWHEVVSGDNLSKIAKKFYGDANKYPVIFEANKPMLTHPDKIYPGQMLRIPPL